VTPLDADGRHVGVAVVAVRLGGAIWVEGQLVGHGLGLDDNVATEAGGGLYVDALGFATLTSSTFLRNDAPLGGGVHVDGSATLQSADLDTNTADDGAGLSVSPTADVSFTLSTLRNNVATGDGGGALIAGLATLDNVGVHDNEAGDGGGVHVVADATLAMSNTNLLDNLALGRGGAVYTAASLVTDHLEVSRNDAALGGGFFVAADVLAQVSTTGLHDNRADSGGAVYVLGRLVFDRIDMTRNIALDGGGIYLGGGSLWADNTHWGDPTEDNTPWDLFTTAGGGRSWPGSYSISCTADEGC
jgi:hypothetical protein